MPQLVRLYIRHVVIGFALALVFTGLLLALNVGNLWHLVSATKGGMLAAGMLVVANAIVFSGVQFAIAVMGMAEREDGGGPRGNLPAPVSGALLAPAVAEGGGDRSKRADVNFPRA
ncbi:MAG: hypothetical protein U1E48_04515 [Paracoccaceae bacterium]